MTTIRKIVTSKVDGNSADNNDTNEIRPFGEIAVYLNTEPNPDKLTLMMFDGTRTHLKSMVLAPGRLYGSDADSGDGNNRDTIKLIPDASLSDYTGNDQYLIVDPTDGNIHIRAGGTIDNSDADLYLGGKQTFVRVSDDSNNVAIRTGLNASIENVTVDVVDESGGVWRMFFLDADYPALGTTVQVGDTVTTSWGTPITAAITNIVQDIGVGTWALHVDQDITAEFNFGDTVTFNRGPDVLLITTRLSKTWTFDTNGSLQIPGGITGNNEINITVVNEDSSTYTWNFGQTGDLTAPGDITTGTNNGRFIQDCADSNTSMRWINVPQGDDTTQLIRAYTGDPKLSTEVERAQIKLNWDQTEDKSGLTIRTFNQTDPNNEVDHDWLFKGDGVLQLPVGGDIVDSDGNSVLSVDNNNIWVQTFVSNAPTTDFPQIATSIEYDDNGNVIALFSHSLPDVGDNGGRYYSVGKYTDTGTKIWTAKFADALNTDGWGLAVDNADDWVYVAGQTNGAPDYAYDVSTLTKIDSSDGSVEWSQIYDFGVDSSSAVVDVDSDGNPVMVGYANTLNNDGYLTITKVDKTNGNVTWTRKLDGQTNEQAYGMAVGPDGEIVAVGYVDNLNYPEPYRTIVTLTATPASDPDWTTDLLGVTSGGLTYDVTFAGGVPTFSNIVDTDGNRYEGDLLVTFNANQLGPTGSTNMEVRVGTTTGEDMSDCMVVVKYTSDGTIAWQSAIQFDADYDCSGADADIDSNGNIYICGQFDIDGGGGATGMALVKFDSSGAKQWSRRVVGNCLTTATSIVVGPDDKLYISGVNGDAIAQTFSWIVAKFSLDGTVEWQRSIENTDSWTFAGNLFGPEGGGSNLAVRQGYVALAGGFGNVEGNEQPYAAILQIPSSGNVFAAGPWSVTAANLSGTFDNTASDITVVNADLTDSDNALNVSADSVNLETEVGNFLVGTVYTAPGGDNSLVNGVYSVVLGNTGTVTLPSGGTITEVFVTSNPTIQLTPASPTVASQKLVIKGGGGFNYTYNDNGININYYNNTAIVGDTLTFYIYSNTYADQTLYWWIYPEGANISDPGSGTVTLTDSAGTISFVLDSDSYEFTVRVSPEDHNYGPGVIGVESGLINADDSTFDVDHHLHLTTGDLTETSIFLGTDDHNVRTTTDGGIEITTPNETNNVWQFGTDGSLTLPIGVSIDSSVSPLYPKIIADSGKLFSIQGQGSTGSAALAWTVDPDAAGQYAAVAVTRAGGDNLAKVILQAQSDSGDAATVKLWKFDETGALTIPGDIRSETGINIDVNLTDSTLRRWRFGEDGDLTFPDGTNQSTALVQGEQIFTLDTGAIDYAPTVVDFNLLIVTPAGGYSSADPTSVTLPNGVPGQRLVIFNGYNLATLTVNPGPTGRDISSGVIAEFIFSSEGWIPLYGTNSPT